MESLSRRILMITVFAARNGILSSAVVTLGQEPPHGMTKLVVRLESPDIPEYGFAAKPKARYRAGNGYCGSKRCQTMSMGRVPAPEESGRVR